MSNITVIQCSRQIPKTTQPLNNQALSNCVETSGLAKIQPHKRHIFSCADQTAVNCCSKQVSLETRE